MTSHELLAYGAYTYFDAVPSTPAAPVAPVTPTASGPSGTVNFSGSGRDFDSIAAWIQRIGSDIPSFSDLWVPNASKAGATSSSSSSGSSSSTGPSGVTFSSTANITAAAKSTRDQNYKVGP